MAAEGGFIVCSVVEEREGQDGELLYEEDGCICTRNCGIFVLADMRLSEEFAATEELPSMSIFVCISDTNNVSS